MNGQTDNPETSCLQCLLLAMLTVASVTDSREYKKTICLLKDVKCVNFRTEGAAMQNAVSDLSACSLYD